MGTSSTKTIAQELKINDEDWEYLTIEHGQQIVKHRWKDIQGEVDVIVSDPLYPIQDEMEIYHYRKDQEKTLVEVYCAEFLKSSEATMCGNQKNIKVIHQRIPHRLRDLPVLTFPQAIYILSESLRGFRECYDKVGSFQINDRMIGINKTGNVKVWLNEEYSSNHPSIQRPSLQITASNAHKSSASKEQSAFVRNIIETVKGKLEEKKFPAQFERMVKEANGFYETYSVIEKYCKEKSVWVPDRIVVGPQNRRKEHTAESTIMDQERPNNGAQIYGSNYIQPRSTYVSYPFPSNTPPVTSPRPHLHQQPSSPYTPYRLIQPPYRPI